MRVNHNASVQMFYKNTARALAPERFVTFPRVPCIGESIEVPHGDRTVTGTVAAILWRVTKQSSVAYPHIVCDLM